MTEAELTVTMQTIAKRLVEVAAEYFEQTGKSYREAAQAMSFLYMYDARIEDLLDELDVLIQIPAKDRSDENNARAGEIMEEVAYLAFQGVCPKAEVASYKSSGEQIDIDITSMTAGWGDFAKVIGLLCETRLNVLVECKATEGRVDHPMFARFCHIVKQHRSQLGVFFTIEGASGFTVPGSKSVRKSLSDAHEAQVLFFAMTSIPIVVFDIRHLRSIKEAGLPVVLASLINEVRRRTGWAGTDADALAPIPLPAHLAKYLNSATALPPVSKADV